MLKVCKMAAYSEIAEEKIRQRIIENSEEIRVFKKKYLSELNKRELAVQTAQKKVQEEIEKRFNRSLEEKINAEAAAVEEEHLRNVREEERKKQAMLAQELTHQMNEKKKLLEEELAKNKALREIEDAHELAFTNERKKHEKLKSKLATRLLVEQLAALEAREAQKREERQQEMELEKLLLEKSHCVFPSNKRNAEKDSKQQWKESQLEHVRKKLAEQTKLRNDLLKEKEELLLRLCELEREEKEREKEEEAKMRKATEQEMLRKNYKIYIHQAAIKRKEEKIREKAIWEKMEEDKKRIEDITAKHKHYRKNIAKEMFQTNLELVESKKLRAHEEIREEQILRKMTEENERFRQSVLEAEIQKLQIK